ncbi:MAG TPA: UDP-3-O-(3-hydroxymyristoyl)glucosamine N-acyltransferase [Thermoanaerobaculia bacterium]|nr:UDP-3-O-(3-hydroxymyristoyl)glucosamine N-acyltransferase [Thermoanaerobaculia bacterium]
MTTFSVAEIADRCGGRVSGDGGRRVRGVRSLEAAGAEDLSFAADAKAEKKADASAAGALLARSAARFPGRTVVEVADPSLALAAVLALFHPRRTARGGVHPTAVVGPGATVDPTAELGPYAVIGDGTAVGAGVIVEAHVAVGRNCVLGDGAWLHPHVVLYDGTVLGARVEVHSGTVLGADGFGYAPAPAGIVKVPQAGRVVVEEDVEIGANTCIDRATLEETRIGAGTKIDDLVMIGHNCTVGRHGILCGQVGLAGSTTVGDGVVLGGQVGVAGHLRIGHGAKAGAQSGIEGDIPDGATVFGSPSLPHREAFRVVAELRRLPETARAVRELLARDGKEKDGTK